MGIQTAKNGASRVAAQGIWLAALATAACSPAAPAPDGPPDIFIVLVDTLRADHLGCYGYELPTSPEIDAFAARATVFEQHTSQSNSTAPSIISMMTGVHPRTHSNYFAVPLEGNFQDHDSLINLAERLGELDYECRATWSHPMWQRRGDENALERGWHDYQVLDAEQSYLERIEAGDARRMTDRALASLDAADGERPLLLLTHYFDPHAPYSPPDEDLDRFLPAHLEEAGLERFESLLRGRPYARQLRLPELPSQDARTAARAIGRARYDEEIRDLSREVGRLLDGLEERGRLDSSIVILLADHGENMGGADAIQNTLSFTHGGLYEGVIGTPFIVKLPGQREGRRVARLSQNLDLIPTLLDQLDLELTPPLEGRSLLPLLEGDDVPVHDFVVSESSDRLAKAIKDGRLKLLQETPEEAPEVVLWREDERTITPEGPDAERYAFLTRQLRDFRPRARFDITLAPRAEATRIELAILLGLGRFEQTHGPGWTISPDGKSVTWGGTTGDEPVRVGIELSRPLPPAEIGIRDDAAGWVAEDLWIGSTPLVESDLFQVFVPADDAREAAEFSVRLGRTDAVLELDATSPLALMAEVAQVGTAYEAELDLVDGEEIVDLMEGPARARRSVTVGADAIEAGRLAWSGSAAYGPLRMRLTADGRWVSPERVRIDDRAVDGESVRFVWDAPIDSAVRDLLTSPLPESLPENGIVLTYSVSGVASDAAPSGIDRATHAELKALGYAE